MFRSLFLLGSILTLSIPRTSHADDPTYLQPDQGLGHPLASREVAKADSKLIKEVFFGPADPEKAVGELYTNSTLARDEATKLAKGITRDVRKGREGTQPDGRVAWVWWNTATQTYRRSSAEKDHTFHPDTDRLVAALAVLSGRSLGKGKVVAGDPPPVQLPTKWTKPAKEGGFGIKTGQFIGYLGGQALGRQLGGTSEPSAGNFAPEPDGLYISRCRLEGLVAEHARKNPDATIVLMMLYAYPDKKSRLPLGWRFIAADTTEKLGLKPGFLYEDFVADE